MVLNKLVVAGVNFPELNDSVIRAHQLGKFEFIGFVDDRASKIPVQINGFPVIGEWNELLNIDCLVINSVAKNCNVRKEASIKLDLLNAKISGLVDSNIHASCDVHNTSILLDESFFGQKVSVGANSIIHRNAFLGHDVVIQENCFLGPRVVCLGRSYVASNSFIGAGAILVEGVRIGRNSVIAAGSVVFNDIPDGRIVIGNPAKIVGKNE